MTEIWVTIAILCVVGALIKASGVVLMGERDLDARGRAMIALLGPALLAALVVTQTFSGEGREIVIDERLPGVAAAGVVLMARASMLTALLVAAGVTAALRGLL